MNRYWTLQGPSRFLDRLISDLRAGASVALFHPPHWPEGCRPEVARRVRDHDLWEWHALDVCSDMHAPATDPAHLLARKFVVDIDGHASPMHALATASRCEGLVVWVEGLTNTTWQAWRHFLEDYDQIVRNREACRILFLFDLPATLYRANQAGGATLRCHAWNGSADPYDMQVLAWNLLSDLPMTHLHRRLAVATICECAGNDEALLRRLVDGWEVPLVDPEPLLLEEAGRRGWDAHAVESPDWSCGTLDRWNGTDRVHSCAVALRGDRAELRRRLWTAHVSVVFPFLEHERSTLLAEMASVIRLPHATPFGVIEDARDLEFRHLLNQARSARLGRTTIQWLECLVTLRNRLAHLEPLERPHLEHPEFMRRLGPGVRHA